MEHIKIYTILNALWTELEYLKLSNVNTEVYFHSSQAGDNTTRKIQIKQPVFIQRRKEAHKVREVTTIIIPQEIILRDF